MNILEARRRTLGGHILKKTAQGNPAIATDSLARRYPGITMQGWTDQDGTPTPEAPVPIVSAGEYGHVEVEVLGGNLVDESTFEFSPVYWKYENGVFETEQGAATYIYKEITLCPGYYTFSADCISINGTGKIQVRKGSEILYSRTFKDTGRKSISFEAKEGILYRILVGDNDNGAMSFMNIMLNPGTTPLPYEPYKIPQTVTLTADRPLTKWDKLTKKNGVWGWEYKSAEAVLDGSEEWSLYLSANVGTVFYTAFPNASFGMQTSLCDKYRNINNVWGDKYNGVFGIYSDHSSSLYKYFRPPSAAVETVEQWKAWLSENPLTLWYETDTETFVPLTAAEQEAMNALHTYRPTTVLSNEQDCDMTLTYKSRKGMS